MSQAEFSRHVWYDIFNSTNTLIVRDTIITLPRDNNIQIADCSLIEQAILPLAICLDDIRPNRAGMVIVLGDVESDKFNFDTTLSIYLSSNGMYTQNIPVTGVLRPLGHPITTTKLYFNPTAAIILAV